MTRYVSLTACLALLLGQGIALAADPRANDKAATPEQIAAAMKRGVVWLEKDMVAWREKRKCAACHHGPLYLTAISIAARQGFPVDQSVRKDMTDWLLESRDARIFPAEPDLKPGKAPSRRGPSVDASLPPGRSAWHRQHLRRAAHKPRDVLKCWRRTPQAGRRAKTAARTR